MKRLRQLRNSIYIIFIFLVSVISVTAAMLYAKDAAYFGTPTNISIVNNSSDLRTATLNQAIAAYADTHDLVIIKRVYPKIDGKIIPKSYVLGHQKQHMIGVPDASIEHRKILQIVMCCLITVCLGRGIIKDFWHFCLKKIFNLWCIIQQLCQQCYQISQDN